MTEENQKRLRENWLAVKEAYGNLWAQTCASMKDDLMSGMAQGQSVMGRALIVAFHARREGKDDVADLILALGYEFSANEKAEPLPTDGDRGRH